jgi:DNA mismatch repair protein MutS
MIFRSILFANGADFIGAGPPREPAFFADLNLDQAVRAITAGKDEYDLKPFFYAPLNSTSAVKYRQEIFRDLESVTVHGYAESFAGKMRDMREHLAQAAKLRHKYQKASWFSDAVETYCGAVSGLLRDLMGAGLKSRGLLAFRAYLADYVQSPRFVSLLAETAKLKSDLSTVRYCVLIMDGGFTVRKYESETDYSAALEETFEKFKQGAVKDYLAKLSDWPDMNHIEAQILDFVALLYPAIFAELDAYCTRNGAYLDRPIGTFDREIQFYIAYLAHISTLQRAGLKFCYPSVSSASKEVHNNEGFDLALAQKLVAEKSPVICNGFDLRGKERIFVVTGPNQGGKTTFARTFGQLHYLASLGCLVPGASAQLFLCDRVFTHFEKAENAKDLRGKLEDDLLRIRAILNETTPDSVVIMNEIFTSTALKDAVFLSKKTMERLMQLDALGVFVTFIDELSSLSEKTVSVASTVIPENPAVRTFKIVRRRADGLAYAMSIAEKHHVTYQSLKDRIAS